MEQLATVADYTLCPALYGLTLGAERAADKAENYMPKRNREGGARLGRTLKAADANTNTCR